MKQLHRGVWNSEDKGHVFPFLGISGVCPKVQAAGSLSSTQSGDILESHSTERLILPL